MPATAPKAPGSRALVMHLSVPAEGGLRSIASELAARIAEHLGAVASDAQTIGTLVEGLASRLGNRGGHRGKDITFEFRQAGGELVIEGRCEDEISEVRHRLTA